MKNLLFLAKGCPNKIKSGGDIRALKMLQILREQYEIDVVARSADYGDSYIKAIGCRSHLVKDMKSEIKVIVENQKPEVIIISHWTLAEEMLDFIKSLSSSKIIIDSIDLEFLRLERKMQFGTIDKKQVEFIKNRELAIYKKANSIIMASDIDEIELQKYGSFSTILLPCLFDINYNYKTNEGRNSYIVCNWSHEPNVYSTLFICKEIIPKLNSVFYIVGKHPPKDIVDFASEKIIVCGAEYEIDKFLMKMNVLFCPVFYGAGSNFKIGQSLAFGIPVVTSEFGAKPYGLKYLEHCMIAENKNDFIKCANEIFDNKDLRSKLSVNGKELIKNFTLEAYKEKFLANI